MQDYLQEWQKKISIIEKQLAGIDHEQAKVKPAAGKWCINEIMGHLIDSAVNNHRRFILMQINKDLFFDGYDQDKWVDLQNYIIKDLKTLVEIWEIMNLNIISLLSEIPGEFWKKSFSQHNLNDISFKAFPQDQPVTAKAFVQDYYEHMVHHLKQIYTLGNIKVSF